MTRCPSGHFYDASKGGCPTCVRLGQAPSPTKPAGSAPGPNSGQPRTAPLGGSSPLGNAPPKTTPAGGAKPTVAGNVTKAIWPQELGTDPIVGWLVAYQGKSVGRDFRLRTGRMRIGRADQMDVQIDDEHISRENHAFIVFDPMNCQFLLQPGEGRGLVYLSTQKQKPQLVVEAKILSPYDIIILGKTHLFFVPFCGPNTFQWQEKGDAPQSPWSVAGPEASSDEDSSGTQPSSTTPPGEW